MVTQPFAPDVALHAQILDDSGFAPASPHLELCVGCDVEVVAEHVLRVPFLLERN